MNVTTTLPVLDKKGNAKGRKKKSPPTAQPSLETISNGQHHDHQLKPLVMANSTAIGGDHI
jgi:hypothetical protein